MPRPTNTFVAGNDINASEQNANWTEIWAKIVGGLLKDFVLGENIADRTPVVVGTGVTDTAVLGGTASSQTFADINNYFSQKFTTPSVVSAINSLTIHHANTATGATNANWDFQVDIYADNAGVPTGASLGNATGSYNNSGGGYDGTVTYTFSSPVSLNPSTDYHFVLKVTGVSGYGTATSYANNNFKRNNTGSTGTNSSTNSGSTWSAINGAIQTTITYRITTIGRIYKTNATSNDWKANGFVGFTQAGGNIGDTVEVKLVGVVDGLTSLTVGSTYYLADSAGTISSSAGSQSRKIGIAVSATELLLKSDNV